MFHVYLILKEDNKKDVENVKKGLLAKFEKGQLNRGEPIQKLAKQTRMFAYKVMQVSI